MKLIAVADSTVQIHGNLMKNYVVSFSGFYFWYVITFKIKYFRIHTIVCFNSTRIYTIQKGMTSANALSTLIFLMFMFCTVITISAIPYINFEVTHIQSELIKHLFSF